jgi:hypothetical protein
MSLSLTLLSQSRHPNALSPKVLLLVCHHPALLAILASTAFPLTTERRIRPTRNIAAKESASEKCESAV